MSTTNFIAGTVIASDWLNDADAHVYDQSTGAHTSDHISYFPAGTGGVATDVRTKLGATVSVKDRGAVGDGVTDDYAAFAAAWAIVKSTGGTLWIPPGNYLLNTQWVLDVDLTLPHNYLVLGYGATLFAGAAVTGHAILVYKGYNNFGVKIEGLQFNHRNNTTVNGCIQLQGANHCHIVKCSVEHHNTKATYASVEIGPYTPGDDNTNSFWNIVDEFTTRQRSGGDGTNAAVGVRLLGQANATKIINCQFTSVTSAIRLDTDGVGVTLANGCRVFNNDFEGVTNAIYVNTAIATTMTTGFYVSNNRVETATTFFNIAGSAATDASNPPVLRDNYLVVGSVTNYLVNPNNQFIFSDEPSYFGVGARNFIGGPSNYTIITEGTGKNLVLGNLSGTSNYAQGHIVLGTYHIWVEAATGDLRIKNGVPASDSDGTVVGTQT